MRSDRVLCTGISILVEMGYATLSACGCVHQDTWTDQGLHLFEFLWRHHYVGMTD